MATTKKTLSRRHLGILKMTIKKKVVCHKFVTTVYSFQTHIPNFNPFCDKVCLYKISLIISKNIFQGCLEYIGYFKSNF